MSEKNSFELDELPDKDEMTAGDVAKLETDPDYIAFRDGTLPPSKFPPASPEKLKEIIRKAKEANGVYEDEDLDSDETGS